MRVFDLERVIEGVTDEPGRRCVQATLWGMPARAVRGSSGSSRGRYGKRSFGMGTTTGGGIGDRNPPLRALSSVSSLGGSSAR